MQTITPLLYDLGSPEGLRAIVTALFCGYNYRLYTEGETRHRLLDAYRELDEIRRRLPSEVGYDGWEAAVRGELDESGDSLAWWLVGLTSKTANNLGLKRADRPDYLSEVFSHIQSFVADSSGKLSFDDAMVMLWAGAATLTIRGSRKSSLGKVLEGAFLRVGLTILGLSEDDDFWLNMQRDAEVLREVDAEVASRRGRIRVEMGLIERGNQEVIEDKINRVGRGGIVIFDQIGPGSSVRRTAEAQQVCFIQIRNNRPLSELYGYLKDKTEKELAEPPSDIEGIRSAVGGLPDKLFIA